MPRRNVAEFVGRDVREARQARKDHAACVLEYERRRAELRSTIVQSRAEMAEVRATLRRITRFIDDHRT